MYVKLSRSWGTDGDGVDVRGRGEDFFMQVTLLKQSKKPGH